MDEREQEILHLNGERERMWRRKTKRCERLTSMRTIIGERRPYDRYDVRSVAPRFRGPERPVHQPRDQVFWHTSLLDIELNNFLLTKIGVHEVYYNASEDTACSSGSPQLYTKQQQNSLAAE